MELKLDTADFDASLNELSAEATREMVSLVRDGAELLADTWRLYVPTLTDHYRDSINVYMENIEPGFVSAIVDSGLNDDYDVYLEFGTHRNRSEARFARKHHHDPKLTPWRMAPHPSLRPAVEATRDLIADLLGGQK